MPRTDAIRRAEIENVRVGVNFSQVLPRSPRNFPKRWRSFKQFCEPNTPNFSVHPHLRPCLYKCNYCNINVSPTNVWKLPAACCSANTACWPRIVLQKLRVEYYRRNPDRLLCIRSKLPKKNLSACVN